MLNLDEKMVLTHFIMHLDFEKPFSHFVNVSTEIVINCYSALKVSVNHFCADHTLRHAKLFKVILQSHCAIFVVASVASVSGTSPPNSDTSTSSSSSGKTCSSLLFFHGC